MKQILHLTLLFFVVQSCQSQDLSAEQAGEKNIQISNQKERDDYQENKILAFQKLHPDSLSKSISLGTVGKGSLKNGKLMPFEGENYFYFDTSSYLAGRAFVNQKVKMLCMASYKNLNTLLPGRKFGIMECSNECGGKLQPHFTHQNGLSVDFMTP